MHQHDPDTTPELAPYRLASWKRAPGAWELADSILAKWQAQADRRHQNRMFHTTGRHTTSTHLFMKRAS